MRRLLILVLLASAACTGERATPLTETDWTNGRQPCSENRLSFRDGRVAYYPRGKPALVIFEIEEIGADPDDASMTNVVMRPAQITIDAVHRIGMNVPDDFRARPRFRVRDGRLHLVGYADADGTIRSANTAEAQSIFDLIRCPT